MLNVFDVERGSYHDGPGLRTVLFLKGCPLSCRWCQNPESQSARPQILQYEKKCIGCHHCLESCPNGAVFIGETKMEIDRELCRGCGSCADHCFTGALCLTGGKRKEEDLLEELLIDRPFYDVSGGGVTISGGEPLMQAEPLAGLLQSLKKYGIDTAIETCGYADYSAFQKVLPCLNRIYYDVKLMDTKLHQEYCGGGNERILDNLTKLGEEGIPLTVRTPIIPGLNDTEQFADALGTFLSERKGIVRVELLPFHSMCTNKYTALGRTFFYARQRSPESERMTKLRERLASFGLQVGIS